MDTRCPNEQSIAQRRTRTLNRPAAMYASHPSRSSSHSAKSNSGEIGDAGAVFRLANKRLILLRAKHLSIPASRTVDSPFGKPWTTNNEQRMPSSEFENRFWNYRREPGQSAPSASGPGLPKVPKPDAVHRQRLHTGRKWGGLSFLNGGQLRRSMARADSDSFVSLSPGRSNRIGHPNRHRPTSMTRREAGPFAWRAQILPGSNLRPLPPKV